MYAIGTCFLFAPRRNRYARNDLSLNQESDPQVFETPNSNQSQTPNSNQKTQAPNSNQESQTPNSNQESPIPNSNQESQTDQESIPIRTQEDYHAIWVENVNF